MANESEEGEERDRKVDLFYFSGRFFCVGLWLRHSILCAKNNEGRGKIIHTKHVCCHFYTDRTRNGRVWRSGQYNKVVTLDAVVANVVDVAVAVAVTLAVAIIVNLVAAVAMVMALFRSGRGHVRAHAY